MGRWGSARGRRAAWAQRAIAAASLTLLLFALAALPTSAQQAVTLSGRVANGTPGGAAVAGDEVAVAALRSGQPVTQKTVNVGPDGSFQVSDLPFGNDLTYAARVVHDGVPYWSESIEPQNGALPPADVTVYEKTDDSSKVTIERHSVALLRPDAADHSFQVLEYLVFRNDGDRTWAPSVDGPSGPMGVLRFSLPDGVQDFRPGAQLAGEEILGSDRGFGTEMPVLPGRNEVTFAYRIKYGTDTYVLTKTLVYGTEQFTLQVPAEFVGQVVGLDEMEQSQSTLGLYRQFAGRNLSARTALALHLRGLPGAPMNPLADPIRWGALGLSALAAAAAAVYALRRGRGAGRQAPDDDAELARRLAALQLARERGEVDQAAYDRERVALLVEA